MWEKIDGDTKRLKVPGGWVVRSRFDREILTGHFASMSVSVSQVYVPDSKHEWKLPDEKTEEG